MTRAIIALMKRKSARGGVAEVSRLVRNFTRKQPGAGVSPNPASLIEPHYPYVRPLQLEWEELLTGYRARRSDPARFEVICVACGDVDGPRHLQPEPAKWLRGPYDTKKEAERVARSHETATLPRRRSVPRPSLREQYKDLRSSSNADRPAAKWRLW
jgi:hypothetical protein